MITVASEVERILKFSPYLKEGLQDNIINLSALARKIKPEIEQRLFKEINLGAVVMALSRQTGEGLPAKASTLFNEVPDMMVRSSLVEFAVRESESFARAEKVLLGISSEKHLFLTLTHGIFEVTVIASKELQEKIRKILKAEEVIGVFKNVASITIKLTPEVVYEPGVYYGILRALAWDEVNIIEVVSSYTELTIIFDEEQLDRGFSVLKNYFVSAMK